MKVGFLKAAMAVLLLFVGTAALFLLANGIESEGLTITGSARPIDGPLNVDAQSREDKIAELQRGPESNGEQANEKHGTFFNIGADPAQSNSSIQQLSRLINLSSSKSKIKSSMSLEGDFEVQRSSNY